MPSSRNLRLRALLLLGPVAALVVACSSDTTSSTFSAGGSSSATPDGADASAPVTDAQGNEDLTSLPYAPHFEADYNTLTPQPWVEPVTEAQRDDVIVTPTELVYNAALHPEVQDWQAGRVVVAAPGSATQTGKNPLGFARRVVSVRNVDGKLVVATERVELEDLVSGDFQSTFDPSTGEDVDLSKLDLDWAIANLYTNDAPVYEPGATPLLDDWSLAGDTQVGDPLFGSLGKFVSGAVKAVANTVTNVVAAITPKSFEGSVSLAPELSGGTAMPLFTNMSYKKQLKGGKYPVEAFIKGSAAVDAYASVRPAFQVGARVPNILNKNAPRFAAWMNVDARSQVKVDLDVNLEAGISSANGKSGNELQDAIEKNADFAQEVLGQTRKGLLGDPDMKPAGGWRKPVYLSKPQTKIIMAGPVPVVLVTTVQVDVECGFEAKASINGKIHYEQAQTFKFTARYEKGGTATLEGPSFDKRTSKSVSLTGGGSLAVTCGLIPRINTMLYDTAGLNVGIRGSLVAQAAYESKCAETTTTPKAEVAVGLYANVGVQVGGRLQAPGSSFLGKSGQSAGFDIGPFEPWNTQFPIFEKTWDLAKGLGYCTPLCKDGKKDANETDIDCGGGACGGCAADKKCSVSSDCAGGASCVGGKCKAQPCFDGVLSGAESDIDCGGTCSTKCKTGNGCQKDGDCSSGFCFRRASKGVGVCMVNHCADGVKDADESGVDCGGALCQKCATGAACTKAADCASGIGTGAFCVASTCEDKTVSAGETDIDCGGTSACRRCGVGQACAQHSDCGAGPYKVLCTAGVCTRPAETSCSDGAWTGTETDVDCGGSCGATCALGKACQGAGDCASAACAGGKCVECVGGAQCASGVCAANACAAPSCSDGVKNGDETATDCGGTCATTCQLGAACRVNADCTSQTCTDGVCAAPPPPSGTRVFVSSAMYTGDLGGVSGADAKCQGLADAANLNGTFKAYIADGTGNAATRHSHRAGPYVLVDGTVVAADAAGFFSSAHASGFLKDEKGADNGGEVWTGLSSGSGSGSMGCGGWTSTGGTGMIGLSWETSGWWSTRYSQWCNRDNVHLYCVEQ